MCGLGLRISHRKSTDAPGCRSLCFLDCGWREMNHSMDSEEPVSIANQRVCKSLVVGECLDSGSAAW